MEISRCVHCKSVLSEYTFHILGFSLDGFGVKMIAIKCGFCRKESGIPMSKTKVSEFVDAQVKQLTLDKIKDDDLMDIYSEEFLIDK